METQKYIHIYMYIYIDIYTYICIYILFFFFAVDLQVGVENIKTVEVCHGNTTIGSICIVVELKNIL